MPRFVIVQVKRNRAAGAQASESNRFSATDEHQWAAFRLRKRLDSHPYDNR